MFPSPFRSCKVVLAFSWAGHDSFEDPIDPLTPPCTLVQSPPRCISHIPKQCYVVVKRVSSYQPVSCKSFTSYRLPNPLRTYFSKILAHVRLPEAYDSRRLEPSCLGGRSRRDAESLKKKSPMNEIYYSLFVFLLLLTTEMELN